jgi:hypothetical protein
VVVDAIRSAEPVWAGCSQTAEELALHLQRSLTARRGHIWEAIIVTVLAEEGGHYGVSFGKAGDVVVGELHKLLVGIRLSRNRCGHSRRQQISAGHRSSVAAPAGGTKKEIAADERRCKLMKKSSDAFIGSRSLFSAIEARNGFLDAVASRLDLAAGV